MVARISQTIMENLIIQNPDELNRIKREISEDGAEKLHVLADFDRTLTKAFVDGKSIPSLISILRDENYLTPDYPQKAKDLYAKYHSIEINTNISLEERKKAMKEWWATHFELLIKSGLNKKDIESVVASGRIRFREGFADFADFLKEKNIPLVIMSSSGLGGDPILMCLEKEGKLSDNIYIISNSFEWDKEGKAVAVKGPIIHSMNKDETMLQSFLVFEKIKERKNILLLGGNLGDVGMVEGFDYENLIKVGFLNEAVAESLAEYKKNYDVVILNDSSFDFINKLLREMVK